jgi:hypothetical protein
MHKKTAFLLYTLAALISFSQAHADPYYHYERSSHSPHADSGTFEIKSADNNYRIGLNALLQPRLSYEFDKNKDKDNKNNLSFDLGHPRIGIHGNAFDPALTYLFQVEFRQKDFSLIDYSVNWACNQRYFHVALGRFALPFSRQRVISPAKYQFYQALGSHADLQISIPNARDVGLMLHNGYNNSFEYALAVMNEGITGRLAYNFNGIDGYEPVDFVGGAPRFAFGLSGHLPRKNLLSTEFNNILGSADFIFKAHGFSTNSVLYYKLEKNKTKNNHRLGAGIDLGYLVNNMWEPVLRYEWSKPDEGHRHRIQAGLNIYTFGHNFQTQLYAGTTLKGKEVNPINAGLLVQFAL